MQADEKSGVWGCFWGEKAGREVVDEQACHHLVCMDPWIQGGREGDRQTDSWMNRSAPHTWN